MAADDFIVDSKFFFFCLFDKVICVCRKTYPGIFFSNSFSEILFFFFFRNDFGVKMLPPNLILLSCPV